MGWALLAVTLFCAAPTTTPEAAPEGWRVTGIGAPYGTYTSDQGFGFGVAGSLRIAKRSEPEEAHVLAVSAFIAQRGNQSHWVRYVSPWLDNRWQVDSRIEYRSERLSPFYGSGNSSAPDFTGNVLSRRFNFDRHQPGGFLRLSLRPSLLLKELQVFGAFQIKLTTVHAYDGSILAEERPTGINGGTTALLWGGASWDTRNDLNNPSSGAIEELSFRLATKTVLNSDFTFGGVTVSERRFFPVIHRVTFAQRILVDAVWGDPPFYELSTFGGFSNVVLGTVEGLGGATTARGLPRNRYVGNIKALSNSELRYEFFEFPIFGQGVTLSTLAFLDFGRVWENNVDDGPWYKLHSGFGGGIRAVSGGTVARVDVGFTPEPNTYAAYLNFGQVF